MLQNGIGSASLRTLYRSGHFVTGPAVMLVRAMQLSFSIVSLKVVQVVELLEVF